MIPPVVLVMGSSGPPASRAIITPPSRMANGAAVAPPAASMASPRASPTGTRSVTGVLTAPATVRYLCVTGRSRPMLTRVSTFVTARPDVLREAAGGDHLPGDVVDEDELVAGGVGVGERNDADARRHLGLQGRDDVVVLVLDPDDRFCGADAVHGRPEAAEHGLRLVLQQLLVLVEERLAFGRVHEEDGGLRLELHSSGEAPAASSDDPVALSALDGHDRK